MLSVQANIEALYSSLSIPTLLFNRDADGNWFKPWQNSAADSVFRNFDINEQPLFKLELIDSLSKSGTSSFHYPLIDAVEDFLFIATPVEEDLSLIHI